MTEQTVLPRLHQQPPAGQAAPPAPPAPASPADQIEAARSLLDVVLALQHRLDATAGLLELVGELLKEHNRPLPRVTIDAAEAAAMYGIGVRTWWTWNSEGAIPRPIRIGGGARTLWSCAELRGWVRAGAPDRATWEKLRQERRLARARRGRR